MNVHVQINTPWSAEEKARVLTLDLEGWSASQIANAVTVEFGNRRTRNAVIGVINRSGFRERRALRAPSRRAPKSSIRPQAAAYVSADSTEDEADDWVEVDAEVPSHQQPPVCNGDGAQKGVALNDLEPIHCRNPIHVRPYLFCGKPKVFGTSWCEECAPRMLTAEGYARLKAGRKPPVNMGGIR